jgi:hypothetical protein
MYAERLNLAGSHAWLRSHSRARRQAELKHMELDLT